ncbi:hypothetical protein [Nitrospirillum amazonense]|uniref:Uncharacterized protein n=1 Tax=Nitrospirillum amazonense TaxID=28077 RepID=A0A560K2D9_9PROT|nr:hypothetical protein [Nitrospirillum amazonense]MDG3443877.1 hypothetical protein [Nitrospirillum amazonense]TWB77437.1 hypothetical protein FBZ87_103254 [Nitrospirillum amazonense]
MSPSIYLLTLLLFFGTFVLIFGFKYFSAAVAARAKLETEAGYRALAERAVAAQAETQAALAALTGDMAKLAASLAAVERILRDVE